MRVAYASKRQLCISLSPTEVEVMAASAAATEVVYQRGLMRKMGIILPHATVLHVDNTSAIALIKTLSHVCVHDTSSVVTSKSESSSMLASSNFATSTRSIKPC